MYRISSNLTLFFKMFIPILWTSVFGMMSFAIFLSSDRDSLGVFNYLPYKIGFFGFFVFFLLILYFSLWQLKRVESDDDCIYATNYFKTVKIGIGSIEKMTTIPLGFASLVTLKLKTKSSFGRRIHFLSKKSNFDTFLEKHQTYFDSL